MKELVSYPKIIKIILGNERIKRKRREGEIETQK